MSESKRFVRPGEEVGTEEEFEAGTGTLNEDGRILASIPGTLGGRERRLDVIGHPALTPFAKGTWVVGRIENIAEPVALAVVGAEELAGQRAPKSSAYVVLHASYIKRGYVKKVRDEYRIGDIIRARIVELKNGEFHISTDDPHAGCLIAFCPACREPMEKRPAGLQCPACERRDNRKLADDYKVMPLTRE
ncbi:MAG: exosome complex RNA-binding protein Csl4 [Candidatus Marsarchaeota archaeon]|nr:exosome complex RNA-binding protein Csl4 [Candidatus Marsarchaeota archaeon]